MDFFFFFLEKNSQVDEQLFVGISSPDNGPYLIKECHMMLFTVE